MTALSGIAELKAWVTLKCPAAGDYLVLAALRRVLTELLEKSQIWREDIAVTSVKDQAEYALTPTAASARVHVIDKVIYDTASEPEDERTYYLDIATGKLVFETAYIPQESGLDLTVTVVLVPDWKPTDANLPAWAMERYGRGLAYGAIAEILGIDTPSGAIYRRKFLDAVDAGYMDRQRGGTQRQQETEA